MRLKKLEDDKLMHGSTPDLAYMIAIYLHLKFPNAVVKLPKILLRYILNI